MSPARKVLISVAAAAVVLAAAVYFVGARETLTALRHTGWPAFATAGATIFALMAFQAAAWARLERELGDRPRFRTLLSSTIVAMAGNIIMPSAHLGGEPAKILYAGRNTGIAYTRLAGTVLLCKYIEAMSFVLFFALGAAATLLGLGHVLLAPGARALGLGIVVVTALALAVCTIMWLSLARRWTLLSFLAGVPTYVGLRRRFFRRLRQRSVRMELWASRVFREERHAVFPAFCWYLLTHVLLFVRPLAFFYLGWGIKLNVAELGLIFLASQVMLAVQFMPSGIGTLDGGMMAVVTIAGMPLSVPQCAAYLLCIRFWDASVVGLGMMLAARTGMGLFRGAPNVTTKNTQKHEERTGISHG